MGCLVYRAEHDRGLLLRCGGWGDHACPFTRVATRVPSWPEAGNRLLPLTSSSSVDHQRGNRRLWSVQARDLCACYVCVHRLADIPVCLTKTPGLTRRLHLIAARAFRSPFCSHSDVVSAHHHRHRRRKVSRNVTGSVPIIVLRGRFAIGFRSVSASLPIQFPSKPSGRDRRKGRGEGRKSQETKTKPQKNHKLQVPNTLGLTQHLALDAHADAHSLWYAI